MTTRPHKKAEPTTPKSRTLTVEMKPGESHDYLVAKTAAGPHFSAAGTIIRYGQADAGELSLTDLAHVLKDQADTISRGDLRNIEAMLGSQATALNVMFAELARRAAVNMGEYINATEIYLKLALRAQSQCRATLETLAVIKNPPVVFAKQANIAHGHQQVNNGTPHAHAEQIVDQPNELLEKDHDKRLDTRAADTASGSDPALATVEGIHGAANCKRQGRRQP
ncbi:hypothetical protein DWU98_19315 [Dyella monticola]|uniref:Uncharacterized protein n=1 Tax=Dyella monticola TaxID=1927958 RepID=A0A370WT94_9GAMM|nr:hypothetical protein [Dyella monticola]RDS79155.1 hypothetical protein DWU98_19315 [Dyella monticola]